MLPTRRGGAAAGGRLGLPRPIALRHSLPPDTSSAAAVSGETTSSLTPPTLTLNATAGSKRADSTAQQQDPAHSSHTRADHGGMAQRELT